jgi:heat-inducible transcriptional repressor
VLSPRQALILHTVVDSYQETGQPVGSKTLSSDPRIEAGPSTIRNELAMLEEHGLLAHPHTSAGRVPTDAGLRWHVDHLQVVRRTEGLGLDLVRQEVDDAMRTTAETLAEMTSLLAIVSAPPLDTATVKHVEVLLLQSRVVTVVVITSTGGVTKKLFTFDDPVDPGLASWAGSYLSERLTGIGLGARMLHSRIHDSSLSSTESAFIDVISHVFTDLAEAAENTLYVDGAARLFSEYRWQDLDQINQLMTLLERRAVLLAALHEALAEPDVLIRIGSENELPAFQSLALVAAGYGTTQRKLGTVSLIGPVHMDYGSTIGTVRAAARELNRFVEDVYES